MSIQLEKWEKKLTMTFARLLNFDYVSFRILYRISFTAEKTTTPVIAYPIFTTTLYDILLVSN